MKPLARFIASALLACSLAPAAHADHQLYLRWDNCYGDGGTFNKTFACDTNSGTDVLVGSFRLDATFDSVSSADFTLDIAALGGTLPPWWSSGSGTCRQGSLTSSFLRPATSTICLESWDNLGGGGVGSFGYQTSPSGSVRINGVVAVPPGNWFTATAGQEFFVFQVRFSHIKTVGPSACAGCNTPVCIALNLMRLGRPAPNFPQVVQLVGFSAPGHISNVTWQPGAVPVPSGSCTPSNHCVSSLSCEAITPSRASTWGSIKSLYR
jgi:hypothetical protein